MVRITFLGKNFGTPTWRSTNHPRPNPVQDWRRVLDANMGWEIHIFGRLHNPVLDTRRVPVENRGCKLNEKFRVPTPWLTKMADFNGPCEIGGVERALTKEPRATGYREFVYQPLAAQWMEKWSRLRRGSCNRTTRLDFTSPLPEI